VNAFLNFRNSFCTMCQSGTIHSIRSEPRILSNDRSHTQPNVTQQASVCTHQ
jgi:hypothetical protein